MRSAPGSAASHEESAVAQEPILIHLPDSHSFTVDPPSSPDIIAHSLDSEVRRIMTERG